MKLHLFTAIHVAWWAVVLNAGLGLIAHAVFFVAPDGRDAVLHDLGIFALLIRAVFFNDRILIVKHEPSN
jgi:hypothetical protein